MRPARIFPFIFALLLPVGLLASCYDPPAIPRDRPLTCASAEAGVEANRCPEGFQCIGDRICAPDQCLTDDECPLGLVCSERFECDLARSDSDGGARDGGAGDTLPDVASGSDAPLATPDAPAGTGDAPVSGTPDTLQTNPTFDAAQG